MVIDPQRSDTVRDRGGSQIARNRRGRGEWDDAGKRPSDPRPSHRAEVAQTASLGATRELSSAPNRVRDRRSSWASWVICRRARGER